MSPARFSWNQQGPQSQGPTRLEIGKPVCETRQFDEPGHRLMVRGLAVLLFIPDMTRVKVQRGETKGRREGEKKLALLP